MKVGIQTWGSRGDIVPWIALSQALKKAGNTVEFYYANYLSDEDFSHYSEPGMHIRSTKDFRADQNDVSNILIKPIFEMTPDDSGAYLIDEVFTPYEPEIERVALHLCEHCDFIIINPILYQTTTIAQKYQIPILTVLVDYLFVPKDSNELFDAEINKLFASRVNRYREKYNLPPVNNVRAEIFNSPVLNLLIFSNLFKKENILLNHKFVITGFLKLEHNNIYEFPETLNQFLREGPAPVFFSMGSLMYFEAPASNILDIFAEAIQLSGCRAIIQGRWNEVPRILRANKNIYTIGFIPHEQILSHCLAAVHHGGAGTTHTTLGMGCPSIVVAYAWDQFYWGRELMRLGAAPGLIKRKSIDALQLAGDIRKIMMDREFKIKANAARMKIKREHGVRKAVNLIEEYISKMKTTHQFTEFKNKSTQPISHV